jgi:hypothetical protein
MSDDLNGSLRLDLPKGSAELRGEPVVVLPAHALETLLRSSPSASRIDMGRDVGVVMGQRVASRLGGENGVRAASTEDVVNALATEIALAGLGEVSLERWGRAMVIGLSGGPLANQTELLGGLVGGAIGAATGTQASAVSIGNAKYFVGSTRACDKLRDLLTSGTTFGEAIARIQGVKS